MQLTFTNGNNFDAVLYSVDPLSTQEVRRGDVAARTSSSFSADIPAGTEWRVKAANPEMLFDAYQATSDAYQSHVLRDCHTELQFGNRTSSTVFLFSVDPVSKSERAEGSIAPGKASAFYQPMGVLFPNTEWQARDTAGAVVGTYFTTTANQQSFEIVPAGNIIPETGTVVVPVLTDLGTISQPLENPALTPTTTQRPPLKVEVGRGQDSILSVRSFNLDVAALESSIRERAGLTEKDQIRAAVYAALMGVARNQNRTAKEQALMDWLALQVKRTRIEAARLALAEYDRWDRDPWSYQPPGGYDFPAYVLLPPRSFVWLASTPNPPVLANESWQRFVGDILASGGWSPLNNPIVTQGQHRPRSIEGVVGFPVFGAVLAYQKLYSTAEGATALAHTMAQLVNKTFTLAPLYPVAGARDWAWLATVKTLYIQDVAPYTYRLGRDALRVLMFRAGRIADLRITQLSTFNLSAKELQDILRTITSADAFSSLACTVVLTLAVQALIGEIFALDTKRRLRGELVDELKNQQAAPLPNLQNLLYYDIRGEVAVVSPDYQPTEQSEIERLTGSQEVYRAFLLATID
jgi:hypothetical protein